MLENLKKMSKSLGLHPLVGFGMFAVDMMLFGGEVMTLDAIWPITVGVGALLTVPIALIQKHSFGDSWGAAWGKGLLVGILTGIPTPLPAIIPLLGGALGTMQMLGGKDEEPPLIEGEVVEEHPKLVDKAGEE